MKVTVFTSHLAQWAVACSLALLLWLVFRWYHPGTVIAFIDLFPIYAPLTLLQKTFWAWNQANSPFGAFGLPTYSTYYLLYALLAAMTNSGLAQILSFWGFLVSGWLGTFVLCRHLRLTVAAAFLAAWSYTLNPFSQFLVGFTTGSAYAATLPWLFFFLHRASAEPRTRPITTAALALLSFLLLPWIGSTPQLFFELILSIVVLAVFLAFEARPGFLRWLAFTSMLCLGAAAWWVVPTLFALYGNEVVHATQAASVAWTFTNSSLVNNLRFVTPWTWGAPSYLPYSQGYDNNVITYASGFWMIAMVCVGLLLPRHRLSSLLSFLAAGAVVALFVAKGPHAPLASVNAAIYRIPGFFLLIESVGVTITALLFVSIILGIVLDVASRLTSLTGKAAFAALCSLTLAAAMLSASPLLNGLMFSELPSSIKSYVRLPEYWRDAAAFLQSRKDTGAVLVLPENTSYQAHYDWNYEGVDIVPTEMISRPVLVLGPSLNYFSDRRLEAIKLHLSAMFLAQQPNAAAELRNLGFRYVLCREDIVPSGVLYRFPDCHTTVLANSERYVFGKLVILDLGEARPRYAIPDRPGAPPSSTMAGPLDVVSVPGGQGGSLVDDQLFNREHMAFAFTPLPGLPKHEAAGWRNQWRVPPSATILVVNAVNAFEIFFVIGGIAIVALLVRAARQERANEFSIQAATTETTRAK